MAKAPSTIAVEQTHQLVAPVEVRALLDAILSSLVDRLATCTAPVVTHYVRTKLAAQYLTLDAATLVDWRSQPGKGPLYRKIGGRVVYSVAELDAWLEQHPLQGGVQQ